MRINKEMQSLEKRQKVFVPKDLLHYYYVESGKTIKEISKIFCCSADTIGRRLKEYKIPKNDNKVKLKVEDVVVMYENSGLTMQEIGEKYSCSRTTVRNRLENYGYPVRKKYIKELSDYIVVDAYEKGESITDIALRLGVSKRMIHKCLKFNNVKIRNGKARKNLPIEELLYLYTSLGKSIDFVAKFYGCAPTTVSRRIRYAGHKVHGNKLRATKEDVCEIYNKTKSICDTANYFECAYETVKRRLGDI